MFALQENATRRERLLALSAKWIKRMEGHPATDEEVDKIKADVEKMVAGPLARASKPFERELRNAIALAYMVAARQIEQSLAPLLREAAVEAGTLAGLFADQAVPVEVLNWANEYAAYEVTAINATTRRRMANVISAAMRAERRGVEDVARALDFFWPEMGRDRTRLIAHTEMGDAMSAGAHERSASLGSTTKEWLTVGDDRVSQEVCAPNEMEGRIKISKAHQSGHLHPTGHPRCRCAEGYTGATRATVEHGMSDAGIAAWMLTVGSSAQVAQALRAGATVA